MARESEFACDFHAFGQRECARRKVRPIDLERLHTLQMLKKIGMLHGAAKLAIRRVFRSLFSTAFKSSGVREPDCLCSRAFLSAAGRSRLPA
jgi:hypothetical protein